MPNIRPNLLGISDPHALERAEGEAARFRIAQLQERPIAGVFGVAHLRAINRHIFQDVYPDAGELRRVEGPWWKQRAIQHTRYMVYYNPAQKLKRELPAVLAQAKRKTWGQYDTPQKLAGPLAALYADLDFQHPFADGNSRSLREFTRQWVAEKTPLRLTWEHTGDSRKMRDTLYFARDAEVLRRAFVRQLIELEPHLFAASHVIHEAERSGKTLRDIVERGLVLGQARALSDPRVSKIELSDRLTRGVEEKYLKEKAAKTITPKSDKGPDRGR